MSDAPCENCKLPGREATVRCQDCKVFLCETCLASHNALVYMKQHKIISVTELRSGKLVLPIMTAQDHICKEHDGETKRFYCETCGKAVCRDCIVIKQYCREHEYISLKDAAEKHVTQLVQLTKQGEDLKRKCQDAIQTTEIVKTNLASAVREADNKLERIQRSCTNQVDAAFAKHKADIHTLKEERIKELGSIKDELHAKLAKVENACELSTMVTQMGSDYDITSIYPTLSANLEELNKETIPVAVDETLGSLAVQAVTKLKVPDIVCMVRSESWKETGLFSTKYPHGITIHPDGHVAITSWFKKCAKVFSKNGGLVYTFRGHFNADLWDIAITPDNRYVLPGEAEILLYDSEGNRLKSTNAATYGVNNKPSNPMTLAVDSRCRIIVGLHNTISIHHGDGSYISKFATHSDPCSLAVTSKEDIVVIFDDKTMHVMDYSGSSVRVVQPPRVVNDWYPWRVCCSKQGEIFVLNFGDPKAVYRYTADGDQCLGRVITGLDFPRGIAITEDGQQLFVTELKQHMVKIFERQ